MVFLTPAEFSTPIVNGSISPLGAIFDVYVHIAAHKLVALSATGQPIPTQILAKALVDTGASGTCVHVDIIRQLGLAPSGTVTVHTPTTTGIPQNHLQYDVALWLPLSARRAPHNIRLSVPVIEADLTNQGIGILLGRNVLERCLLVYNGPSARFTVAFE